MGDVFIHERSEEGEEVEEEEKEEKAIHIRSWVVFLVVSLSFLLLILSCICFF